MNGRRDKNCIKISHLVINEVLPTDWSPSKTIFVLLRGDEDEKSAVVGVPDAIMQDDRCQWQRPETKEIWWHATYSQL